jgi:hypothetical protein
MAWDSRPDLLEDGDRRADLAGRAEAALEAVMLDERGLHGVQAAGRAEALDGRDPIVLVHHGEAEACVDAAAIHDDGAGTALAVIAAFLRSGEMQVLAQRVEQRGPGIELQRARDAVHLEGHGCERGGCRRSCHGARRRGQPRQHGRRAGRQNAASGDFEAC